MSGRLERGLQEYQIRRSRATISRARWKAVIWSALSEISIRFMSGHGVIPPREWPGTTIWIDPRQRNAMTNSPPSSLPTGQSRRMPSATKSTRLAGRRRRELFLEYAQTEA